MGIFVVIEWTYRDAPHDRLDEIVPIGKDNSLRQ